MFREGAATLVVIRLGHGYAASVSAWLQFEQRRSPSKRFAGRGRRVAAQQSHSR